MWRGQFEDCRKKKPGSKFKAQERAAKPWKRNIEQAVFTVS